MNKLLLGLTSLVLLTGCVTQKIPKKELFRQIQEMPYEEGKLDCRHKARLYQDILIEEGYDAYVVQGTYYNQGHAWVETEEGEVIRLYDPTIKQTLSGYERKFYDEYIEQVKLRGNFNIINPGDQE